MPSDQTDDDNISSSSGLHVSPALVFAGGTVITFAGAANASSTLHQRNPRPSQGPWSVALGTSPQHARHSSRRASTCKHVPVSFPLPPVPSCSAPPAPLRSRALPGSPFESLEVLCTCGANTLYHTAPLKHRRYHRPFKQCQPGFGGPGHLAACHPARSHRSRVQKGVYGRSQCIMSVWLLVSELMDGWWNCTFNMFHKRAHTNWQAQRASMQYDCLHVWQTD